MFFSVVICLACFLFLVVLLRRKRLSMGLPIAYMASLLLIHVPGPIAYLLDDKDILTGDVYTEIGFVFATIGSVCFVIGVWLSHLRDQPVTPVPAPRTTFWNFSLYAGILITTISYILRVPTFGAILQKAGPIWMLAVMCGLRSSLRRRDTVSTWRWLGTLALYPTLMLLLGGFLSYGSTVAMTVLSALAVTARSGKKVFIATLVLVYFGISVFLGYFQNRTEIREAVWGGQDTESRIAVSVGAIEDVAFFNPDNPNHLKAFDLRLNQNYFSGLAAYRIQSGVIDYLYGKTVLEGALSIIPRALWPDKPIKAGSPKIVGEMTGLQLSQTTSFGVGNVMEFQINFGIPGVIIGFLLFGFLLGWLDRRAFEEETKGELGQAYLYFLPAVAIIQPNGSLVEVCSGGAAAFVAALGWRWAWQRWPKPKDRRLAMATSRQLVRTAT